MSRGVRYLIFLFCGLGVAVSGAAVLGHFFGVQICTHESCRIVESYSVLPQWLMSMGALLYFAAIAVCSFFLSGQNREIHRFALLALSTAALCAEAVLIGRQTADYSLYCPYCMLVAVCIVTVASAVLIGLRSAVPFIGACAAFLTLILTPLKVKPAVKADLTLVYASNCPHCRRVVEFCKEAGIKVHLCPESDARVLFRALDLKGVPVLLVRSPDRVLIISGEKEIKAFLKNRFFEEVFPVQKGPFPFLKGPDVCLPGGGCD